MGTKAKGLRVMSTIHTNKSDADEMCAHLRHAYRRDAVHAGVKVRVFERAIKAGGARGTVWCVVSAYPAPVVAEVSRA